MAVRNGVNSISGLSAASFLMQQDTWGGRVCVRVVRWGDPSYRVIGRQVDSGVGSRVQELAARDEEDSFLPLILPLPNP